MELSAFYEPVTTKKRERTGYTRMLQWITMIRSERQRIKRATYTKTGEERGKGRAEKEGNNVSQARLGSKKHSFTAEEERTYRNRRGMQGIREGILEETRTSSE